MLLSTVQLEGADEQLFSKETSLLGAGVELCYRTISCCALNAEQLCRDRGLEVRDEGVEARDRGLKVRNEGVEVRPGYGSQA